MRSIDDIREAMDDKEIEEEGRRIEEYWENA